MGLCRDGRHCLVVKYRLFHNAVNIQLLYKCYTLPGHVIVLVCFHIEIFDMTLVGGFNISEIPE